MVFCELWPLRRTMGKVPGLHGQISPPVFGKIVCQQWERPQPSIRLATSYDTVYTICVVYKKEDTVLFGIANSH